MLRFLKRKSRKPVKVGNPSVTQASDLHAAASTELRDLVTRVATAAREKSLTEGLSLPLGDDEMAILADAAIESPPTAEEMARVRSRDLTAITARVLRVVREDDEKQRRGTAAISRMLEEHWGGSDAAVRQILDELNYELDSAGGEPHGADVAGATAPCGVGKAAISPAVRASLSERTLRRSGAGGADNGLESAVSKAPA